MAAHAASRKNMSPSKRQNAAATPTQPSTQRRCEFAQEKSFASFALYRQATTKQTIDLPKATHNTKRERRDLRLTLKTALIQKIHAQNIQTHRGVTTSRSSDAQVAPCPIQERNRLPDCLTHRPLRGAPCRCPAGRRCTCRSSVFTRKKKKGKRNIRSCGLVVQCNAEVLSLPTLGALIHAMRGDAPWRRRPCSTPWRRT